MTVRVGNGRRRVWWLVLGGAVAACLLAVCLRMVLPSDGARVGFYAGAWSADSVGIDPIDPPAAGLRPGDAIVAVDGRPLAGWAAAALDPGAVRPADGATYTIRRGDAAAPTETDTTVAWTATGVGATLAAGWSVAVFSLATAALAGWVFRRRPDAPAATALVLAAAGIVGSSVPWYLGTTVSDVVRGGPFVLHALLTGPLYMLTWPAGLHLALVFPTTAGPLRSRPWVIPGVYVAGFVAYAGLSLGAALSAPSVLAWIGTWPAVQVAVIVPFLIMTVATFVIRHVRTTDPAERARRRLATLGLAGSAALGLVLFMGPVLLTGRPLLPDAAIGLISLPMPMTLALAIVHDRLFDIDVVIRRTLVYGGLTLGVVVAYLVAVTALTRILGPQEYAASLLATGLAALAALPLRDALQHAVDRLLYGQRDQPVRVMRRLGMRLEWATDPAGAFPAVVETLADALRLPYVALEVAGELGSPGDPGGQRGPGTVGGPEAPESAGAPLLVAEHGRPPADVHILPLVHGGERVGRLLLGLRAGESAFSPTEAALLADLARQTGAAVHAQRLRDDLARSRERLVVAREEERRRLRHDLHDGLGPTLAAIAMRAEAAAIHLDTDRSAADADLAAVADDAHAAVADLRRLVDGLRPPSLDQLGLARALHEQVERLSAVGPDGNGPTVTFETTPARLPALPAAIEVAAYRIALEALTNAIRHAGARTCAVRLVADDRLTVEVADDGQGLADGGPGDARELPATGRGTGLESMRRRAAEVGGVLSIEPAGSRGTIVRAQLPLPTPAR
ncbi:MAG TPA: histidine kinase [Candidatus Limnocylindrales bacterium]|nr:histidine kinase [Candidatus Limnocylindrales bacterium]